MLQTYRLNSRSCSEMSLRPGKNGALPIPTSTTHPIRPSWTTPILLLEAAERKYMFLLKEAKAQGLTVDAF